MCVQTTFGSESKTRNNVWTPHWVGPIVRMLQVNGMAVYLRTRRGFRCLSLSQPYWQHVQSLGTGREAIPGQLCNGFRYQNHIGFFCQNRWQVNGMAVYLRARRGFRCLSLPQPYWQCVQSLGTGREAIPGQLYTVAVTKSPPGQRPRKGARTAEFMMTRPLYGRRTSFKPSHTSPDIIR